MSGGRTLRQLVTDRMVKHGLYDRPEYWDMKATQYHGLARSNWPSNVYNEQLHVRQMQVIDELLGDVSGLRVADVGCGTGRTSQHLARRGAEVVGLDFSPRAIEAAAREARDAGLEVAFQCADVLQSPDETRQGQFDIVLSLGCLTLACADEAAFERALAHLVALLRPGGRLLFVEPIHASRLLGRILRMTVDEWIRRCEQRGLRLETRGGLLFVPARYALAFVSMPLAIVAPAFRAGEWVLSLSPVLERLSDYKWLLFRAADRAPESRRDP